MGVLDLAQAELASSDNPGSGNRVEVPAPSCQCEVSVFALVKRERRTAQPFTRWRNRSRGAQQRRNGTSLVMRCVGLRPPQRPDDEQKAFFSQFAGLSRLPARCEQCVPSKCWSESPVQNLSDYWRSLSRSRQFLFLPKKRRLHCGD